MAGTRLAKCSFPRPLHTMPCCSCLATFSFRGFYARTGKICVLVFNFSWLSGSRSATRPSRMESRLVGWPWVWVWVGPAGGQGSRPDTTPCRPLASELAAGFSRAGLVGCGGLWSPWVRVGFRRRSGLTPRRPAMMAVVGHWVCGGVGWVGVGIEVLSFFFSFWFSFFLLSSFLSSFLRFFLYGSIF